MCAGIHGDDDDGEDEDAVSLFFHFLSLSSHREAVIAEMEFI